MQYFFAVREGDTDDTAGYVKRTNECIFLIVLRLLSHRSASSVQRKHLDLRFSLSAWFVVAFDLNWGLEDLGFRGTFKFKKILANALFLSKRTVLDDFVPQ